MLRKLLLVVAVCVVLLVLAKLLGLFPPLGPFSHQANTKPPIPKTKQTTWTIKLHATGATVHYDGVDFDPPQGGCQWATGTPDPKNLKVCQNDIVLWKATTPLGENESIVYLSDQFFKDAGNPGNSATIFVGNNGGATNPPGLVDAPDTNWHKWSVIVLDKKDSSNNAKDEPKIKVGG